MAEKASAGSRERVYAILSDHEHTLKCAYTYTHIPPKSTEGIVNNPKKMFFLQTNSSQLILR